MFIINISASVPQTSPSIADKEKDKNQEINESIEGNFVVLACLCSIFVINEYVQCSVVV